MTLEFPESRTLTRSQPRRTYCSSTSTTFNGTIDVIKGLHYGQRKLFLSEVEFLTALLQERRGVQPPPKPLLVVYAGAANGSHLPFLFSLFPTVRFVLIDPAPFCQAVVTLAGRTQPPSPIVELIEDCCTDELCCRLRRDYHAAYELVLVSDIRSGAPSRSTNKEHTAMILRDNQWQEGWCYALEARCAMLKFHPPYPKVVDPADAKFEADDDTPSEIEYLDGTLLWGVWAPKSSSEVRLVVNGPFVPGFAAPRRRYHCTEFEEQCYAYNTSQRYAADCAAEQSILERYLRLEPTDRSADVSKEGYPSATALSAEISKQLGYPLFVPLTCTEDAARFVTMLYLSRDAQKDARLYGDKAPYVSFADVVQLVSQRFGITSAAGNQQVGGGKEGEGDREGEEKGTASTAGHETKWRWWDTAFWSRVANPKALGEAYSFPTLRHTRPAAADAQPWKRPRK